MTSASSKVVETYRAMHPKSAALYERARAIIPGGVTHDGRHMNPFPVYVERALGSHKWDVDGHDYVDYWMGHGALFLAAPARTVTIGIGDGGNEIGMGTVRARVARAGAVFRAIASVVKVQHLVVAGVSNWGAYGVVAELARLAGRPLLHTAEEEEAMVRACVDAGAVDGLTRRAEPTVDGLPLPAHIGMLELLRTLESPRGTGGPKK